MSGSGRFAESSDPQMKRYWNQIMRSLLLSDVGGLLLCVRITPTAPDGAAIA